jgi:hypothetical protein
MISSFLMFVNFYATFVMLSLCYAQHPSYLFHIVFSSLNILQHYVDFDIRTIVTLVFGTRSFDGSISYLVRCQAILLTSLSKLDLLSIVRTIASHFWMLGIQSILHLSIISNNMITLFF